MPEQRLQRTRDSYVIRDGTDLSGKPLPRPSIFDSAGMQAGLRKTAQEWADAIDAEIFERVYMEHYGR